MENQIHNNYIKASELIFISIGLGVVNIFLSPAVLTNSFSVFVAILIFLFMLGNTAFIRQGYRWAKILYIVLFVLGLFFDVPSILKILVENPIVGIINLTQIVLQTWALILLIQIPNDKLNKPSL